ncbi:MAG: retroviral-like aspartic protease family protein, partial [Thermoplasmata archaeon]|nr:retroviral-like aspartic protease family protein [Thermoplasmata archaeon]
VERREQTNGVVHTLRYSGLIPITFFHKDGTRAQLLNNAILDSGAYEITIPKALADMLGLELRPRSNPVHTAGGQIEACTATINFTLGRGGRFVQYTDVDICVMKQCPAVLIGIRPIFEDYTVTIIAHQQKCILEPKE